MHRSLALLMRACGRRDAKHGNRQFAFDKAIDNRAGFNDGAAKLTEPFAAGERVLTRNGEAELVRMTEHSNEEESWHGYVVIYRHGSTFKEVTYSRAFGHKKGSARLQRVPPYLRPPPRATSSLATSFATRKAVYEHAHVFCKVSPHQRPPAAAATACPLLACLPLRPFAILALLALTQPPDP